MGDLPRHGRTIRVIGGDNVVIPPTWDGFDLSVNGVDIGDKVRRAVDEARIGADRGFESLFRNFGRAGSRVDW
jgi:hypothetical protein